ncbi:MAG: hypothetical protein NW701_03825 [Nitrospira sp.]
MNRSRSLACILLSMIVSVACNSEAPEPAVMEWPPGGLRVTITRVATHPFLARYNLTARVERRDGCIAASDLFPDTGHAGRRNLYLTQSGALVIIGQYDARLLRPDGCTIQLVEFHQLEKKRLFLGTFDIDEHKRWRFLPPDARSERPFES